MSESVTPYERAYVIAYELTTASYTAVKRVGISYAGNIAAALDSVTTGLSALVSRDAITGFRILFCTEISDDILRTALFSAAFNGADLVPEEG